MSMPSYVQYFYLNGLHTSPYPFTTRVINTAAAELLKHSVLNELFSSSVVIITQQHCHCGPRPKHP